MKKYCKYTKKSKKNRKILTFLFVFLSFLSIFVCYVHFVVNPIVVEATRQMIYSLSTTAVSDAVYDVLDEEHISYSDLIEIEYDSDGNISFITLQTIRLNQIARRFYQVAQVYLDKMGERGIDIPCGAFSGLPWLVGVGPKVNLKLVSIGAMTSTFESSFKSAGINQTNHSLFVNLHASVSLMLPAFSGIVESDTEMLVAESVIVGKIPNVYLSGGGSLNFVPK